jgi:uncharacterized membrane protein
MHIKKEFSCPNCNQIVFTLWQKMNMGYLRRTSCPKCSANICTHWKSVFLVIFLAIGLPSLAVWTTVILIIYLNYISSFELMFLIATLIEIISVIFCISWGYRHHVKLVVKNA